MKTKFLFAGLACALTFGALTPTSARAEHGSSGYYVTRTVGYDRCGHPVYQKVWVPACNHTAPPVCSSSGHGFSHGSSRYSSRGSTRPGFSFHFGGSSSGHSHAHGR